MKKAGALKASLVAGASVIAVEGIAAWVTGSLVLWSDAGHTALDAGSTLILLIAASWAMKPADEDHTYGHGKIEFLGSLIGALILLIFAGGIIFSAILRFSIGEHAQPGVIGYVAATYAAAMEIFRMVVLAALLKTGSPAIKADLYHAFSNFGTTIMVYVSLGLTTLGYRFGDTAMSLILAGFLGYLSSKLIYSSSLELSDSISGNLVQSILGEIHKTREVLKVRELRARRVGTVTYVEAVVTISPYASITEADTIASKIEKNLEKLLGSSSVILHLEPAQFDIPIETRVKNAADLVEGAQGPHSLSITSVGDELYVVIHVQVDPALSLEKAHSIMKRVEHDIKRSDSRIGQVTVRMEPALPERASGVPVDDDEITATVRRIVRSHPNVVETNSIMVYSSGGHLRIDLHCFFEGDESVVKVHETVARIEEEIRSEFSGAAVTIRSEPVQNEKQKP